MMGLIRCHSAAILLVLVLGFGYIDALCPRSEKHCTCDESTYSTQDKPGQYVDAHLDPPSQKIHTKLMCRSKPANPMLFSVDIKDTIAHFSCALPMTDEDYKYIDNTDFPNINTFNFYKCPFPNNIYYLLKALGTRQLQTIEFNSSSLGENKILPSMPNLENIILHNIDFQSIDSKFLQENRNLLDFDVSNSSLLNIPSNFFAHNKELRKVKVVFNKMPLTISERSVFNLAKLHVLQLTDSGISVLPKDFLQGCPSLKSLDLSNNKISNFMPTILKDKSDLMSLVLRNNDISTLDPHLFDEIPDVRSIVLSRNKITKLQDSLFVHTTKLQNLEIAFNRIKELSDRVFSPLTKVWSLDLSFSRIENFPSNIVENMTSLSLLKLVGNNREAIQKFADGGKYNPFLQFNY